MTLDHLVTNGEGDRLCPAMDPELREDVLDVLAHGLGAYEELLRNLGLAEPVDEERHDLDFPRRQRPRRPSVREPSSEESSHACEQLVRIERFYEVVVGAE